MIEKTAKERAVYIENLTFSYPDKTPALENINLEVAEGQTLGVIGPNGAGKSTLLLHLNGILRGQGRIWIKGREVCEKNLVQIRRMVGIVFQDPDIQLFMPTVFEDVSFGPLNMGLPSLEVKKRVNEALAKVDMAGFSLRAPHHLSFGEKKRICLATVLSMQPEILALDEPTSNLDPRHRREFIDLLREIKATKIIATHDLDLVKRLCSKTALLHKGKLAAFGDTSQIIEDQPLLSSYDLL